MWCGNLPRLRGKLSQATFPYKVVINNHSVTIEGNPILFNCSQGFTQILWHITVFLNIECKKYKNLETKCVTTSPRLPYFFETIVFHCEFSKSDMDIWIQRHQKQNYTQAGSNRTIINGYFFQNVYKCSIWSKSRTTCLCAMRRTQPRA